jgi:hypothetical protein
MLYKPTTEDLGTNSPGRGFAVAATPHPSAPLPRPTRRKRRSKLIQAALACRKAAVKVLDSQ